MIEPARPASRTGSIRRSKRVSRPSFRPDRAVVGRWLLGLAGCVLAAALWRSLVGLGGAQRIALYETFLLVVASLLLAMLGMSSDFARSPRALVLFALGLIGALAVAIVPTLEAFGWTHALLGLAVLIVVLAIVDRREAAQRVVAFFIVAVGCIEALIGWSQIASATTAPSVAGAADELARGTLHNRNHFAGLLMMTLSIGLGLVQAALARRSGRGRSEGWALTWVGLLACSVMGVAVLLSRSRAGTLVLIAVLVFLACLTAARNRASSDRGLSAWTLGILLVLVVGVAATLGLRPLIERFARLEQGSSRLALYGDTLRLIADHPLGVGPGMYQWRFRPYQSQSLDTLFEHAENDYLETTAEWGLLPAALWWALVAWRLARSIGVFLRTRHSWPRGLAFGCSGALAAILLHSLIDFNLHLPSNLMVFMAVVALAWSLEPGKSERRTSKGAGA